MNLRQFASLLLLFLLITCSDHAVPGTEPVEIRVSTGFAANGVLSRGGGSIYGANITTDSPLPLSVVRLDQTSEAIETYLPYDNAGGVGSPLGARLEQENSSLVLLFNNSEVYLNRPANNKTKLIGWYPPIDGTDNFTWSVDEDSKVATVSFKVDGETDIIMSNLVEGDINNRFNRSDNTLVFNHLLTRICIRVSTTDETTTREEWGGLKGISIGGKNQTCEVQLPDVGALTNTYPTAIAFKGSGTLHLINKSPTDNSPIEGYDNEDEELEIPLIDGTDLGESAMAGYAMIAPGEDSLLLTIETGKVESGTATITPPEGGFLAGVSYTIILDFSQDKEIIVSGVTITDWISGGTTTTITL